MSIIKEELTTFESIVSFLTNLKDESNTNFFSSVTTSTSENKNFIHLKTTESGESDFCVLGFATSESGYAPITLYNNLGSTQTFGGSEVTVKVAETEAVYTKNGCCLNYRYNGEYRKYFVIGKTVKGKIFVCGGNIKGTVSSLPHVFSHIYSAPVFYVDIEPYRQILNQVLLVPEGFSTPTGEFDMWNKIYFNKIVQYDEQGIMTLDGKSYYTNSYISILDD